MPTLLCFSSNIRPQYEQDIVDVAAAPEGQVVRFRYEERYVDDRVRAHWADNKLVSQPALILYSIQQPENYHPPAFVPVRHATVARTSREGSICVVHLRLGRYAALRAAVDPQAPGSIVFDFSGRLQRDLAGHPGHEMRDRRFSVVEGEVPQGFLEAGSAAEDFERLSRYLAGTVSFASHSFWRVSSIRVAGETDRLTPDTEGRWRLHSNTTYEVLVTHFQPDLGNRSVGAGSTTFDIATDDNLLHVIGDKRFEIASRYDAMPIRLSVPALTEVKETVLAIRPSGGTKGARADLRFLVGPTKAMRAAGGAAAVAAVVLAAVPGLMNNSASFGDKVWFPVLAAAVTFGIGWWALPVRTSG